MLLFLVVLIAFWNPAHGQRSWRVNQLFTSNATFRSLQAAIDSAANGDTLYVEPGNYGAINLTKRLYIFGIGFDVLSYDTATAFTSGTELSQLIFHSGSSGSTVEGFNITDYVTLVRGTSGVMYSINDIAIKRCKINYLYLSQYPYQDRSFSLSNWEFLQCIFNHVQIGDGSGSYIQSTLFRNCIVHNELRSSPSVVNYSNYHGIVFINNVFGDFSSSSFRPQGCVFSNNIITGSMTSLNHSGNSLNSFNNNIFVSNLPSSSNFNTYSSNNIFGIPRSDIFESTSTSLVTHFRLKAGSPALNVASDGGDCGIFGGIAPMPVPPVPTNPRIYYIENDGTSNPNTNLLRLRIKASSGN
jgi:hypothetical protein